MAENELSVAAVVLAAGLARRMGGSKLDLPWPQGGSILGRVLDVLQQGGVGACVVVSGGHRQAVEAIADERGVSIVFNPDFAQEDMLTSIRVGLSQLIATKVLGILLMPADLPLIRPETISALIDRWQNEPDKIWIPSHNQRRGHPVLVPRELWGDLMGESGDQGLRSFLKRMESQISYLNVADPGIRLDIDDLAGYTELKPKAG